MARFYVHEQPELFPDRVHRALGCRPRPNEHGVYTEPDELLELAIIETRGAKSSRGPRQVRTQVAYVELLDLRDGTGWIGAFGYSLPNGGRSGPLTRSFGWDRNLSMAKGATRAECLDDCRAKLAAEIADYVARHKATALTRRVARWIAAGCPTDSPTTEELPNG